MARLRPALALLTLLLSAARAGAQAPSWRAAVPAEAVPGVDQALARARREGLPEPPLIAKAMEGAGYGAPAPRIVEAVTGLARRLGAARAALGPAAGEPELTAGAEALAAGIQDSVLRALRRVRPTLPLTVPLVVLTDLVVRGVPPGTAASAVVRLSARVRDDPRLLALGRQVERDIAAGASPARALAAQMDRMAATLPPLGPAPPKITETP